MFRAPQDSADVSSAGKSRGEGGADPVFAGALRQRLALRAATACAAMLRLREDEGALRDAEHLAAFDAAPTPGGRLHRLWRDFATHPVRLDPASLREAADRLDLPPDIDVEALASVLQSLVNSAQNPLAAAAKAAATTMRALKGAPRVETEILALWVADFALAKGLGWEAPLPLVATALAHPSRRSESGRRPRPDDPDWLCSCAGAYALATQEAFALAGDLSRRSERLLAALPTLRAKGAGRVVALLLADDAVSPARAAKTARLSDRAARRLFDRLVALGSVRELSGRPSFRLYGL